MQCLPATGCFLQFCLLHHRLADGRPQRRGRLLLPMHLRRLHHGPCRGIHGTRHIHPCSRPPGGGCDCSCVYDYLYPFQRHFHLQRPKSRARFWTFCIPILTLEAFPFSVSIVSANNKDKKQLKPKTNPLSIPGFHPFFFFFSYLLHCCTISCGGSDGASLLTTPSRRWRRSSLTGVRWTTRSSSAICE